MSQSAPLPKSTVLLVGHQPLLGQMAAQLLGIGNESCEIRKGTVWCLRTRLRDGQLQTSLLTVVSPDFI